MVARVDGHLAGLARVISDGATIAYLQDYWSTPTIVAPESERPWSARR